MRSLSSSAAGRGSRLENRDWLSVTLPVNPHFREMENPISQRTALKTAPTSHGDINGETCEDNSDIRIYTDCEELEMIKTALKTALMSKPDKILVCMARIAQMILRNKIETVASLAHKLGLSLRTLGVDIALLKKIHAIDRIGPDNGGEWIVLVKW